MWQINDKGIKAERLRKNKDSKDIVENLDGFFVLVFTIEVVIL